jgi:hypothetical protein
VTGAPEAFPADERTTSRGATVIFMTTDPRGLSRQTADHPLVEKGARLGFAANGVLNIVIGYIALQLAWVGLGGGGDEASASGALDTLATTPVGVVALVITIAGFALLGLWYLATVLVVDGWGDRLKSLVKGVTYLVLGGLAVTVLAGVDSDEGESEQASTVTATLMQQPWGRWLVGIAGLVVAGVGIYQVVKGLGCRFVNDLDRDPPGWARHAGRIGYTTRGGAFVLIGGFLVIAAVNQDPEEARGLDGALQALLDLPFGSSLLTAVALGLMSYGVYCFARARYARV